MLLLADFIDRGQADGTIATAGRPNNSGQHPELSVSVPISVPEVLESTAEPQKAHDAVSQARRLRDALAGADVDALIAKANADGEDFGLRGLRAAAAEQPPEPVETPPLPTGRYRCIVIDPPWPVTKIRRHARPDQGTALDYPTMTLEQIAALDVPGLAADGCHIYLWVTHRFLPAGLDLLEQWGARYECLLTWRKNVGITPFSWMYDTEHVIFGRVGSLPLDRQGLRLSFDGAVAGHSVKPDVFYERVIEASPDPRLEMFARRQRDGFIAWGNEVA
jgi:N6-adenosine-specific RNA methylase IME4